LKKHIFDVAWFFSAEILLSKIKDEMKNVKHLKTLVKPLLAALAVVGLVVVLEGCDAATGKPAAVSAPAVSAAIVGVMSITETHEFSGRLEAIDHVDIRARVGGFITEANFKPGSIVKKGEVLFVIDPRPYQAEVNRAEAAVGSARAKADLAKLELVRSERLLADKAIAQREYDEKASGMKELDANMRAAVAQYDAAKLNLGYTQVTSPINGRVSKAEITVGNLVDPSAVLSSVVSTDRIYASFDGDEDTFLHVGAQAQKGEAVTVKIGLANETGFPHEGKLEFIDNQLDVRSGSVRMRATLANTDNVLVPGLFARVQLGAGANAETEAIAINERSIGTDQDRKFVFVVGADGKAEYRAVKLGQIVDGMRVVLEGLKPGEKIIVNGLQRVHPGAPVMAQIVAMEFDPSAPGAKPSDKPAAKDAKVAATSASISRQ